MPALIEFYEQNQDLKDSFEFISVHNKYPGAKDFETLDKSKADRGIVEKRWNGKDMTWPLMIDGDGTTAREWGVFGYPTMAIVDPEGKLHSFGHHHLKAFAEIIEKVRTEKAAEQAKAEK
jgi:predicted DsbA family dithiol-disulfide isomerase